MEELKENDIIETDNDKGWFANVLSSVSNTFSKFIGIFKKNGILYTLLMMLLFIIFWTLIINPIRVNDIIEKRLEYQWEIEKEHNTNEKEQAETRRVEIDQLINPMLDDAVERYKVDRVMLFEFHNGTKALNSNLDFLYSSCSYESINLEDNKIENISDNFQRQYNSQFLSRQIITQLQHKDYIAIDSISNYKRNDSRLITKLSKNKVNKIMIIPINNANKLTALIVVANRKEFDEEEIYNYMKPFIQQIEQNLIN